MAKVKHETTKVEKKKVSRPGIHAKSKTSLSKGSKNYKKLNKGQGYIVGGSIAFTANATLYGSGGLFTSINVNGRTANRNTAGTSTSSSFTLGPGTYSYSLNVDISSGSGSGFIGTTWV